ncbi:MAG TPA: cell division protein [Parabacteroides sp.]|nr:cell division protein [Parabacteroides sp.]
MKSFFATFCLLFFSSSWALGQSATRPNTIFDELSKEETGKGTVYVHQSDDIRAMVGAHKYGENVEQNGEETFLKIQGYRTQVFSGNNQRKSKEEAFRKEKEIKELFPDVPTYVTYNAPFWRLRVGDFRSHEEAYQMMRQLMDAFPGFAKEMYIVKEEVKIPLY